MRTGQGLLFAGWGGAFLVKIHWTLQRFKMSEKLCLRWNEFQDNISKTFGNLRRDTDFSDVTLVCEDGHQVEAHKVILDGSRPQTTIHTHWSEMEDFIFGRWKTKVRGRHLRHNFDEKLGTNS